LRRFFFHILILATLTFLLTLSRHSASADPYLPEKAFFGDVIQYLYLDAPIIIYTQSSKIAFSSDRDATHPLGYYTGNYEIYVMDSEEGNQQTRLTYNDAKDTEPSWAPDGRRIAFASYRDNNWEIYALNVPPYKTGEGPERLTVNTWHDFSPSWSPNGNDIAFTSSPNVNHEIYVINPKENTGPTNLTNNPANDYYSSWSPEGNIVFNSDRDGNLEIYRMDGVVSDEVILTNITNSPGLDYYPSWSPDGSRIAFSSERTGNREIYVMDVEGEASPIPLAAHPAVDYQPSWSPDSKWIAFTSDRDGNWDVWKIKYDGTGLKNLTKNHTGVDEDPDWSPSLTVFSIAILAKLKIATNPEVLLLITEDTVISNPAAENGQELANGQRVMVVADEAPAIGVDLPTEDLATALQVTVIPQETLGHHRTCTVVKQLDSSTSLACDNGDYLELPNSELPLGASTVVLVQPDKPPELIATATSLHERMERFKSLADAQGNPNLSAKIDAYQQQIGAGFNDGFQQAKSSASPAVKQFLETAGSLDDKIADLAGWFISAEDSVIADARDVSVIADLLEQFAGSYDAVIDLLVHETIASLPENDQETVRLGIQTQSSTFISDMKDDLARAADLLRKGELEMAIALLDDATANEEEWENSVVMPLIGLALAEEAIQTAKQELFQYGDGLSDKGKNSLQEKIDELESALQIGSNNLGALIDDLWAAMETAWGTGSEDETQYDIAARAQEMIDIAESDLEEYSDYMGEDVKTNIQQKKDALEIAVEEGDDSLIQDAIDSLAAALYWYDDHSQSEGQTQRDHSSGGEDSLSELLEEAKAEIQTAESMLEGYADSIAEKDAQHVRNMMSSLEQILTSNDRDEIYSTLMNLVKALETLHFEEVTSEDPTYVTIQCPPKVIVGHALGCSFKYDGVLKRHEWTAEFSADSSKITTSDWLLSASYEQTGTVSLSLTACGASKCIDASHMIEIVEPQAKSGETTQDDH